MEANVKIISGKIKRPETINRHDSIEAAIQQAGGGGVVYNPATNSVYQVFETENGILEHCSITSTPIDGVTSMDLTDQLPLLRCFWDLKLSVLADSIGEDLKTVWNVEKGKSKDFGVIKKLENYFGIKLNISEDNQKKGLNISFSYRGNGSINDLSKNDLAVIEKAFKLASLKLNEAATK